MALENACPKPTTRYQSKAEKAKTVAAQERETWAAVDARDGCCCRVCGTFCSPRAIGTLHAPHRHHLVYRSAGGNTTTANLATLCAKCHDAEHRHELRLSGDADARNEMGRLAGIKVERVTESGWQTEGWR
jgi:5-methylcytosine-specific restriction endonuclease McrA